MKTEALCLRNVASRMSSFIRRLFSIVALEKSANNLSTAFVKENFGFYLAVWMVGIVVDMS